ncbi:MAG: RING finger protein [Candidatus Promineifilaceae bacterium]
MLRPAIATKENEYVGEDCALCKQPFAPETELIVCPRDGALHHTYCWEANHNHCTALACEGRGVVYRPEQHSAEINANPPIEEAPAQPAAPVVVTERQTQSRPNRRPPPTRRVAPAREPRPAPRPTRTPFTLQLAQSCVVISIAIAIVVISFSCFGLWAIADFLMIEVFDFSYRPIP